MCAARQAENDAMGQAQWSHSRLELLGRVSQSLNRMGHSLLDLLFPRRCAGCLNIWLSARQGFWCEQCLEQLPWIKSPLCARCGRPFLKSSFPFDHWCGECLLKAPPFTSARSAVQHCGPARDRVNQLKFGAKLYWVPALTELLVKTVKADLQLPVDYIVSVPLHNRRLRQRGFNQAALIAKALGRSIRSSVRSDILIRGEWTQPQTRLSRQERLHNVKNAFRVTKPADVSGCRVLLVDDVFTTGSTVSECSKMLKKAGAEEVHVLTITRALPEMNKGWENT
jgi:ComF family protein